MVAGVWTGVGSQIWKFCGLGPAAGFNNFGTGAGSKTENVTTTSGKNASSSSVLYTWRSKDLNKAFDLVSRSGLFAIPSIILKLHDGMHATVHVDGSRYRRFPIKRGVKKRCVLAASLFAMFFTALLMRAFMKPSRAVVLNRGYMYHLGVRGAKAGGYEAPKSSGIDALEI